MNDNILFFDTETTGVIPKCVSNPITWVERMPRIVQLSWKINDREGDYIIYPDGFVIPEAAANVHKITTAIAKEQGVPYKDAFLDFFNDLKKADIIVAHNAEFDIKMLIGEYVRLSDKQRAKKFADYIYSKILIDTMMETVEYVDACFANGRPGKFPRLEELYAKLFDGESFPAHNSLEDVRALAKCYYELKNRHII